MKRPTMALFDEGGRHVARMIPKHDVISTSDIEGFRLVSVTWEGKRAMMFAQDIRSHGEEIAEKFAAETTKRLRRKAGLRLRKGLSGKRPVSGKLNSKTTNESTDNDKQRED